MLNSLISRGMKRILIHLIFTFLLYSSCFGQGAAVSPSRLYFSAALGKVQKKVITVSNNSAKPIAFQITFGDFNPKGNKGKIEMQKEVKNEHAMSGWMSANPAFIELIGGEKKDVEITLTVPNAPSANNVRWSTVQVRMVKEQKGPIDGSEKTLGLGINETFQFVLYAFQTPPTVNYKKVEIKNYTKSFIDGKNSPNLTVLTENTGDAIVDCATYIELTNMNTGQVDKITPKAYTMLPGIEREVEFELPADLPSGKYSAMAVVDFGSRDEIEAAETTFDIP